MKEDLIIFEVIQVLIHPDDSTKLARKTSPIKWICGVILLLLIGIIQCCLWGITIIPTLVNKWVLWWKYV